MLNPSIYSICERFKGALEPIDAGGGLDKTRVQVVPDAYGKPGHPGVLGRPPGALEVATLQGELGYVRVAERASDLPEVLPCGGLEVHGR
jgi:hypothetical protein